MFGNRINSYTYNPQTPVYNMMFNIKYLIATPTNPTPTDRYFTEVYRNKDKSAAVYENDCFLPIAYAAKTHLKDWAADEGDPFKVQGDYFRLATGLDGVFVPCGYTDCSYMLGERHILVQQVKQRRAIRHGGSNHQSPTRRQCVYLPSLAGNQDGRIQW